MSPLLKSENLKFRTADIELESENGNQRAANVNLGAVNVNLGAANVNLGGLHSDLDESFSTQPHIPDYIPSSSPPPYSSSSPSPSPPSPPVEGLKLGMNESPKSIHASIILTLSILLLQLYQR